MQMRGFGALAISLALAACGGSTAAGTGGAAGSGGSGGTGASGGSGGSGATGGIGGSGGSGGSAGASSCPSGGGGSNLTGVTITFPPQPCTYTLAQVKAGITFRYAIIIDQSVADVVPLSGDAGGCATPGPSGLIAAQAVSGNNQNYCLCDTGLCAPQPQQPVTLQPGGYAGSFAWDGTNWNGPSDTGNPHGAPFPTGKYSFTVSTSGTQGGAPFSVTGSMDFTLVP